MDIEKSIHFVELVPHLYDTYINIGTTAYNQHYRHLWPKGDTTTYINHSFTNKVVADEELNKNTMLCLIQSEGTYVGILKMTLHRRIMTYDESEAMFLDKIYILKEYSGRGIGANSIGIIEDLARKLSKKAIFLEAMQKGKALAFYLANDFNIVAKSKVPFANVIEEEKSMYLLKKDIH